MIITCKSPLLGPLAALCLPISPLLAQAQFPVITGTAVKASLDENGAAWRAKIDAIGRPRLLYDKTGQAELKARLMGSPRSPEVTSLLSRAHALAPSLPHPYVSPEVFEKTKGMSAYEAEGEEWIRGVGDDITMMTVAAALDPSPELQKALHDEVINSCKYPQWARGGWPNSDLCCAHMARGIALAWDWFPDLWSSQDRDLIKQTIASRVHQLLLGVYGKAFWARGYTDNHNHVDCNGLAWSGLAFYNDIPEAPEWLAAARLDFQNVARYFPADGSSAEGVPYWSYGMNFILQYIEGTRHVIDSADLYKAPFLKNAAAYRLNASTCGLNATMPWGDTFSAQDGARPVLMRLAVEYKDPSAAWLSRQVPWSPDGDDTFVALWQCDAGSLAALPLDYHHWVTDIVTTRSGWGPGDYLLAVKSGFTNRNHSHLDAGALALAFGTEWLLTAPGYGKGKNSPDYWDGDNKRWTFFANATEAHCTLLINGQNQRFDRAARGTIDQFYSSPHWCWTGVNLTEAYEDVNSVRREILHRRGDYILVLDSAIPKESGTVEWLAQFPYEPEQQDNSLGVKAQSGQLRVTMLSPVIPFAARQPTSPHIDVPGPFSVQGIHTYSVKASGTAVNYIALLQPSFSNLTLPALKASVAEQKPGFAHLTIQGPDWTDNIFKSDTAAPVTIPAEGDAPGGIVKSEAKITALRRDAKGISSCMAVDAVSLELAGIKVSSSSPALISLQKTPNGCWLLDTDRDVTGRIVTAAGFSVHPLDAARNTFRYLLLKEGTSPKEASDWLASLVVFRETPSFQVHAPDPQPSVPSSVAIPIQSESFARQQQGTAEVIAGKPGAIGKSIRGFGNNAPEHFIIWQFDAPQAGQYQLTIRYATNLPDIRMALLVDGAAPSQALTKLPMPSTGGWSIKEDNWKDLVVADSGGKPFVFNLTQGKHELRLARPTGALALNRFEFRGTGQP